MRPDKIRLKWFRTKFGIVKSERVFAGSQIVRVVIDPTEYPFEFKIMCEDGGHILNSGNAETLRKAKSDAKNALRHMAARFIDEVRPNIKSERSKRAS